MLHRLCGPPSIPLSFSLATVLPRRIAYRVSCGTAGLGTGYTKQSSFRARTTRVSNPVCSPSFRASASDSVQVAAFATGVPPDIYAFHRYTSNSQQRLPPPYYRGCWHGVSRGFFYGYRQTLRFSSPSKGFYVPRDFITHAALLGQGCPHCQKFPTAASRRSLDRVSVPVCPTVLSDRILIVALVSYYLTN